MQDLIIALVQSQLHWEDKAANLNMFTQKLEQISSPADIIVLPEMFTTGFSMNAIALAETMDGEAVGWMKRMAAAKNAALVGSMIITEGGNYYNRLIWAAPDGSLTYYNKRHLFSMAGEEKVYTPGTERLIMEVKGWKICPMVCYDLRFPVWMRNTAPYYDVLIFTANWPERRIQHWRKLLQARAIENESYVAGVNCYGTDGNDINYNGCSMLVSPMGEIQAEIDGMESTALVHLSYEEITRMRRYMPFLKDMDNFQVEI